MSLRELLEQLARHLVADPSAVNVDEFEEDDGTVVLELHVADDEAGKVIGRGGRIARSLRTLLRASGARARERVLLEIVDG